MEIDFQYVNTNFRLYDEFKVRSWIEDVVLQFDCFVGQISYVFTDDETVLEVNRKHLDHDYYTDIITFDERVGKEINGMIYISVDRIKDNSKILSQSFDNELLRVVIHGILHLIGFKDKTDAEKEEMRREEDIAISIYKTVNQ